MSAALAPAGWALALAALGVIAVLARGRAVRAELVVRATHELRAPLTAARLGLHALGAQGAAPQPGVEAVDLELRRAGLALDDLLAAPAGRRAAERRERVEVGELLGAATAAWTPVARAFGRELRLDWAGEPVFVRGDRVRLAQACGNLLANAIEHGGGVVELRGRVTPRGVRIEVLDDGPGLPAAIGRLQRGARRGRGTRGRGLAIVDEIAARHGGRLVAAPTAHGARVALELPAVVRA